MTDYLKQKFEKIDKYLIERSKFPDILEKENKIFQKKV